MKSLRLNSLSPAKGAKKKRVRVGRGMASKGKTCGRGHKGQNSRSGGGVRHGFEGGQMPLHRRVPKFGFASRKSALTAEVRLHELKKVEGDVIDLQALKTANVVNEKIKKVKIFSSGQIDKAVVIRGLQVSKGAKASIEAVGGRIEV